MKILFFDVDGPMVSGRALFLPDNIVPRYGWQFDPCAVGMLNFLGWAVPDLQVVIASHRCGMTYPVQVNNPTFTDTKASWERVFKDNGLNLKIHHDWCTVRGDDCVDERRPKIAEIGEWLDRNPSVKDFVTFDDEAAGYTSNVNDDQRRYLRLCGEDYLNGITWADLERAVKFLGRTEGVGDLLEQYSKEKAGFKRAVTRTRIVKNLSGKLTAARTVEPI